ncbi:MAG: tetratricopeptide repeat protein [Nitrosopumilus sp.]|nr:tetratricopeptide repeat protein [Nitrosopumilus sp.]
MVQSRNITSKLGKYDEAIKSYDKAIEIKPDYQVAKDNQEIVRKN